MPGTVTFINTTAAHASSPLTNLNDYLIDIVRKTVISTIVFQYYKAESILSESIPDDGHPPSLQGTSMVPIQNSPNAMRSGSTSFSDIPLVQHRCVGIAMMTETCNDEASPHSISSDACMTSFFKLSSSVGRGGSGGGGGGE